MPPVGEIKSGKMCSKICCIFLHEALSKCKVATKDLQLRTFTENLLLVVSVTPFKIDQNTNENRSIDKVLNLGNERRYIYKDPRQDSG